MSSSYQPLVSVVIATYNMGAFLPQAIDSVLGQTYRNLEVIVIDDGSSDNTRDSVQPYVGLENFRYVHQENRGQPRAKNAGVRLCRGELIAFCDADDIWMHDKLEHQVPCFRDNPNLAVVSSEIGEIDEHGAYLGLRTLERYSGRILEKMLIKNCISFGTSIVRKDVMHEVGMFDENLPMGIDWDLWLRIAVKYEFLHLNRVTYHYRVWAGQMSRNYRGRYRNAFAILDKFFQQHPAVVTREVRNLAYADTLVGRGRAVMENEDLFVEPLQDYLRALRLRPTFVFAWKSLVKLVVLRSKSVVAGAKGKG